MSVRNQYAKNYTKVKPFPPSNKLVVDSKLAAKRSNIQKALSNKKAISGYEYIDSDLQQNEAQRVTKNGRKIRRYTGNIEQFARKTKDIFDDNKKQANIIKSGDSALSNTGRTSPADVVHVLSNDFNGNGHDAGYTGHTISSKCKSRGGTIKDVEEEKLFRPKSARPESRWERRMEEVVYETRDISPPRQMRPKSARPESRMFRMMTEQGMDSYRSKVDLPERPKTSYGHRRRATVSPERIELERPKSRIGNYSNQFMSDVDNHDIKSKKKEKKSKPRHKKDGSHSPTSSGFNQNDNSMNITSPQEQFTRRRSRTVLDLNSGIDDIDLDVDPVLYFMQDDNKPIQSAENKHSLSKDTIEFIGNTNLMRHSKVPSSNHGDYTDTHTSSTRKPDCYYGNRLNRGNNSVHGRYSSSDRNALIKDNNSFVTDQKIPRQFPGETSFMEPKRDMYRHFASTRARELTSETIDMHSYKNPPQNGRYRKNVSGLGSNQTGQTYRRHPRRLQPITAIIDNT